MLELRNFRPYSCDDEGIVCDGSFYSDGRVNLNWSGIQDKLIRLAAKHTERYASDVIISINCIEEDLNKEISEDNTWMFGFRENGVDHMEWVLSSSDYELRSKYRCIWQLDLKFAEDKEHFTMKLIRVSYY